MAPTQNKNPQRLISLAAGVVQEFPSEQVVYAAAEAGFNAVGVWCELDTWTAEKTQLVKTALDETQLCALDIEVAWFQPGEAIDSQDRFVDIAAEIGARNILCVSSEPNIDDTKKRFEHLCKKTEGTNIRVALEFLAITEINTLAKAREVVETVNHPAGAILVDALHLSRTGSSVENLKSIDSNLLPYIQLCDASKDLQDTSMEGILEDALYLRKLPGQGELPLKELLAGIDSSTPISLEIRSRALIEQFPDSPKGRAQAVFQATQRFLNSHA
jgi:sugar phosphate isomerase/epimerase